MNITRIDLKFCKKDHFIFKKEELKHIKVLPWLSVVQSVKGSYDIALGGGESCSTGEGGIFVAPSNVQQTIVHHNDPEEGQITCRWVFIDALLNGVYRFDSVYDLPLILPEAARAAINCAFDCLFASDDPYENYCCYYEIIRVLSTVAIPKRERVNPTVQNTLSYIRKHYAEEIRIVDLAADAHMSESNFYAVFRKHLASSPIAYLNHYRLSLATEELVNTDRTIGEIADRVGFHDPLYFSRLFHKTYGMSPKNYRAAHRK